MTCTQINELIKAALNEPKLIENEFERIEYADVELGTTSIRVTHAILHETVDETNSPESYTIYARIENVHIELNSQSLDELAALLARII